MEYNYKDWLEGRVTLSTSYFQKKPCQIPPTLVDLGDFNTEDQQKIKNEQKRQFNKTVTNNLNKLKEDFSLNYNNSLHKIEFLNAEINQVYQLIFSPIVKSKIEYISLPFWQKVYDYHFVEQLQNIITKYFVRCEVFDYCFMNSSKSPYFSTSLQIEIVAAKFHAYYLWLENIIQTANKPKFDPNQLNQLAYDFLFYLNEKFEINRKPKPRFSVIYHFLKNVLNDKYHFNMRHEQYKSFVLENFTIDIDKATLNKPYCYDKDKQSLSSLLFSFERQTK